MRFKRSIFFFIRYSLAMAATTSHKCKVGKVHLGAWERGTPKGRYHFAKEGGGRGGGSIGLGSWDGGYESRWMLAEKAPGVSYMILMRRSPCVNSLVAIKLRSCRRPIAQETRRGRSGQPSRCKTPLDFPPLSRLDSLINMV